MFRSLLIANRGEIACRIIRSAKAMGIRTIAVYSDADENALHVQMADTAVHIGDSPAPQSYLDSTKILEAALQSGAEAVHPGYGFLSENADFAHHCAAKGIIFVGPSPHAIRAMGRKDAAKVLMREANVPVVPGYDGDNQEPEFLAQQAQDIGYPVLIKAVAGGGGRGMRRIDEAKDFVKELKAAKRESLSAFGDDHVLIEKYIEKPRHIEVQVFADAHGNTVHLFERDCSLQRRHQKVIEEAPAPGMPEKVRTLLGKAAVRAAQAVDYVGAGTVEFIVDGSQGIREDGFYFMEMNTRLQVEHPVTELITGLDLVELQLNVAAGEALPFVQADLGINGHAVEARLYAEDPARKFLPSSGRLSRLRFPEGHSNLRVDSGVREGDEVSIYYDPMISKVIAWGPDRLTAIRLLENALLETQAAGPHTNLNFLARALGHPRFVAGDVDTHLIDQCLDDLLHPAEEPDEIIALAGALMLRREQEKQQIDTRASKDSHSPWAQADGWRLGSARGYAAFEFTCRRGDVQAMVSSLGENRFEVLLENKPLIVTLDNHDNEIIHAGINNKNIRLVAFYFDGNLNILTDAIVYTFKQLDPLAVEEGISASDNQIKSPLPGKISSVHVKKGEKVSKGTAIVVLEAMKVEHTLTAPVDTEIDDVFCSAGDQVEEGTLLVRFSEAN